MELIRGLTNLRPHHRGSVVTVGGFDGLHLGHQALIGRLHAAAARLRRPTMLVSFEPMPREYLVPQAPPARLTTGRERWHRLKELRLDYVLLLRFGEGLRRLSGEDFAQILARDLQASSVVVGHDFKRRRFEQLHRHALRRSKLHLTYVCIPLGTEVDEREAVSGEVYIFVPRLFGSAI